MKIVKIRSVKTPERGTEKSAGIDFFVPTDYKATAIRPGEDLLIPSGIKAKIPEGYMLMAADKSGVVTSKTAVESAGKKPKKDAFDSLVVIGAKIVDEDYQGEIHIHIMNLGNKWVTIYPNMKIAQFILVPVLYDNIEVVQENQLYDTVTKRNDGGFGSTNNK